MTIELKASFLERQAKAAQARAILQHFSAALKTARFYPPEHPSFIEAVKLLHHSVLTSLITPAPLVFNRVGREIYFGGFALVDNNLAQKQMVNELTDQQIFRLTFTPGITLEELTSLIFHLGRETGKGDSARLLKDSGWRESLPHIAVGFGQPVIGEGQEGGGVAPAGGDAQKKVEQEKLRQAGQIYEEGLQRLNHFLSGVQWRRDLELGSVSEYARIMVGNTSVDEKPLMAQTIHRPVGWDSSQHALNVSILSISLGKFLNFSQEQLTLLGEAALIHDIGTITLSPEILQKQGQLSAQERELFQSHPVEGAALLSGVDGINGITLAVALEHHLRQDGTGYPFLPDPAASHLFSRMVAICDFYDASVHLSQRNEQIIPAKALAYMWQKRGNWFDTVLLKAFIQVMGIYPLGSLVRLGDKSLAFVVANNPQNLKKPWVVLVSEEPTSPVNLMELDESTGLFKYSIQEVLSPVQQKIDPLRHMLPV
jgi:hypothetical protein